MRKAIPSLKKADLDTSIGVFFDGFSKVVMTVAILVDTFGLDERTIFDTVIPGVFLTVVILNEGLWLCYRRIAADCNDPNLTAIPAGLQTGHTFIWLCSIMLPVLIGTDSADLALKTGALARLVGGIVFIIGAFVVPVILRIVLAGALFDSLAGGAMAFLIMQSMNGVLKMPLVGWLSLTVLFVIYLGKMEVKPPIALIAVVIDSVVTWISGVMGFGAVTKSLSNLSLYIPPSILDIFNPDVISAMIPFLSIIIVFSLNEVVTGIQAVKQAKECGNTFFTTTKPPMLCDVTSIVGAYFENPLAVGLYWGYPGWKGIESGTRYHPGIVTLYALVGLTGFSAIISTFISEAVVLPTPVFVGIPSYSQAFEMVDKKYYPAVIMASLPVVMDFIVDNMKEGALPGFTALDPGSTFVGLLVGCVFVFIIDNNWKSASITNGTALALAAIGMIHSPGILGTKGYAPDMGFIQVYIVLIIVLAIMHVTGFDRKKAWIRRK